MEQIYLQELLESLTEDQEAELSNGKAEKEDEADE